MGEESNKLKTVLDIHTENFKESRRTGRPLIGLMGSRRYRFHTSGYVNFQKHALNN